MYVGSLLFTVLEEEQKRYVKLGETSRRLSLLLSYLHLLLFPPSLLPAGPHGQRGFLGNKQEEPPFPEGPEHLARPGWFISLLLMKTQELLWRAMSLPPRAAGPPLDLDATKETAQAKTAGTAEAGPTHVCTERSLR